jgi:hypothetical protein
MRFDFDSPETQSLRNSVAIAREAFEKAPDRLSGCSGDFCRYEQE